MPPAPEIPLPKIGALVIATRRYLQFVDPLVDSLRRYFFTGHSLTVFVLTNRRVTRDDVVVLPVEHKPWPSVASHKYHFVTAHREAFKGLDYLFLIDADSRLVASVGAEILPEEPPGLVGVVHYGYYDKDRSRWTYETDPRSTACIRADEGQHYFAGAFVGGSTKAFLAMSRRIMDDTDADARSGLVAVWHDESHLNRYFVEHPPKLLSPSYCYPELWLDGRPPPFEPRILGLHKDFDGIRLEGVSRVALQAGRLVERVRPWFRRWLPQPLKRFLKRLLRALPRQGA